MESGGGGWVALETWFEWVIVRALQVLVMAMIAVASAFLIVLFIRRVPYQLQTIDSAPVLQEAMQHGFGGILVVLLGLELLETLKVYFHEHRIRVEVILIVAMIAVSRHVIQLDLEHLDGLLLVGIGALVLSLAGALWVARRGLSASPTGSAPAAAIRRTEQTSRSAT